MSLINLSSKQLRQAANLKEKIAAMEKELSQILGSTIKTSATKAPKKRTMGKAAKPAKKKRTMSPEARAKISRLAKARWKKAKAAGKKTL